MQYFAFLLLLLSATLARSSPLSLSRRDHQYSESRRVPVLKSGNALITTRYNVVYKQDQPDWHMTPEEKITLRNDTNRGFCRTFQDSKGKFQMWGTLNIFVMPEIARGKHCRFHWFLGNGDGANGFSRLDLYHVRHPHRIGEFTTTFNNHPGRYGKFGTFAVYPPDWLTAYNPVPDVVADIPHNYNIPAVVEWSGPHHQQIVRRCPVGKVVYDLVPRATESHGWASVAWSMNKGLAIEILGVKKEQVKEWNPHDPTGA